MTVDIVLMAMVASLFSVAFVSWHRISAERRMIDILRHHHERHTQELIRMGAEMAKRKRDRVVVGIGDDGEMVFEGESDAHQNS